MFNQEDSDSESHHSQAPSPTESHVACDKVLWSARLEIMVRVKWIAEALRARPEEPTKLDKLRWDEGIVHEPHVEWDTHRNLRFNIDTFPNKDGFFTSLRPTVLLNWNAGAVSALYTATKLVKWGQWWSQEFVDSHPAEREWWNRPTGKTNAPGLVFKTALVGARDANEALNDIGQGITATWEAIVQYVDTSPPEGSASSCRSGELSEDVGISVD
ncbi:hypothetical protein C8Q80DRAFT_1200478 [Daedaleopsis nitida]|nr:hypothetical protein C8Q80DRAFT_1200478 [Daedaleopsis nitida]